ncbi:MAG: hypothetical protein HDT16_03080 [Oscillibacter sp.]|nr:hypothetical protein [Oscillibacter sp.]
MKKPHIYKSQTRIKKRPLIPIGTAAFPVRQKEPKLVAESTNIADFSREVF